MRQVTRKGLLTVAAASGVLAMSGGVAYADSGAQGGAEGSPGVASGNSVQAPVDVPVNACGNSGNVVGLLNPASGNGCENGSDGSGSSDGQDRAGSSNERQGDGQQSGGAQADGGASNSPGVGSGNNAQAPVDVPVNACGNTITVIGIGNSVTGNGCENDAPPQESAPPRSSEPSQPSAPSDPGGGGQDRQGTGGGSGGQDRTGAGGGGAPQHDMAPETGGSAPVHEASAVRAGSAPVQADPYPAPAGGGQQLAETGGGSELGIAAPLGAGLMIGGYVLYRRARVVQNAARAAQR